MLIKALSLQFSSKEFSYYTQHTFRGLTVSESPAGYNVIIRTFDMQGKACYAMTTATDPSEGLSRLFEAVSSKGGKDIFHLDKYHPSNQA